MIQHIEYSVAIRSSPSAVWKILTDPDKARQWIGEPEMNVELITDWRIGSPIIITGFHHGRFQNNGTVRQFVPPRLLNYTYRSSLSGLHDIPEYYSHITMELTPIDEHTILTVTVSNFPTETIYKHADFYWRTTVGIIKRTAEQQ